MPGPESSCTIAALSDNPDVGVLSEDILETLTNQSVIINKCGVESQPTKPAVMDPAKRLSAITMTATITRLMIPNNEFWPCSFVIR